MYHCCGQGDCRWLSRACAFSPGSPIQARKTLNGAGATFPYPVYSKWAYEYNRTTGVKLNYQSIGSGAGIAQIKAKTVDFGASDAPLTVEELDQTGLVQFPMVMGGVVPVVNVEGVKPGELKLTPALLADIFLGSVKNWDDSAVRKINPVSRSRSRRSPWCTVPTAPGRHGYSPITSTRYLPHGISRSARTRRCRGPRVSAARETKAWRPMSSA